MEEVSVVQGNGVVTITLQGPSREAVHEDNAFILAARAAAARYGFKTSSVRHLLGPVPVAKDTATLNEMVADPTKISHWTRVVTLVAE